MATERLGRDAIVALFAMAVGILVIANDFTALSVAVPAIEKSFNTDLTTAQWVINAYTMVFGVVIVTGGAARGHVRQAAHLSDRLRDLCRVLGAWWLGAQCWNAAGVPRAHGHWWRHDVARSAGDDLRDRPG